MEALKVFKDSEKDIDITGFEERFNLKKTA